MSRISLINEQIADLHTRWVELLQEKRNLLRLTADEIETAAEMVQDEFNDSRVTEFLPDTWWLDMWLEQAEFARLCDVCSINNADDSVQETHGHVCLDCARHGRTSL